MKKEVREKNENKKKLSYFAYNNDVLCIIIRCLLCGIKNGRSIDYCGYNIRYPCHDNYCSLQFELFNSRICSDNKLKPVK